MIHEIKPFPKIKGVEPIPGERNTFKVSSSSRKGIWYRVDLAENGWNGACDCEEFRFRCSPKLAAGQVEKKRRKWRCKHIYAALIYQGEEFTQLIERAATDLGKDDHDQGKHD